MNIQLIDPVNGQSLRESTAGLMQNDNVVYPYQNGAYRIVKDDNYTQNFGYQWNKFTYTQVDKANEFDISKVRFFAETNWDKEDISGKNVLEVGSGAGRFSQVVLDYTKANLYSVDYSNAVEANFKNNSGHGDRFKLFQASVYDLPFAPGQFDKVFCIGVLQHTPDFKQSIKSLIDQAKPNGEIVVDFYPIKGWWTKICAKYILRPFTKKWSHKKLLTVIENNIDWMIKAYFFLHKIKLGALCRFLPICDIHGCSPYKELTPQQLKEWCILDTFDMYSPEHDHPQKVTTVKKWMEESGITVTFAGLITYADGLKAMVVKGIKK